MSLENPTPHLHLSFARPFRPLVSLLVVLTPPLLGWLCPKGQVTRAQEAEENYLVKRELATVKQQSEEASAQLEQAKKTIRQLQQQQQPHAVRRATESPAGRLLWLRSCPVCDRSRDIETGMFPRSVFVVQHWNLRLTISRLCAELELTPWPVKMCFTRVHVSRCVSTTHPRPVGT